MNREEILALYDVVDSLHPGRTIPGYDKEHAARTARIVVRVAQSLGITGDTLTKLEITTLLHDIGRAGMDPQLFGLIFESALEHGLPVRVSELVRQYPTVKKTEASAFFLQLVRPVLERKGIPLGDRVRDHIDMRMAFDARLRRVLRQREGQLRDLGVTIEPWMEKVMLYYYYPEYMEGELPQVRLMGMVLVACENFEAYNNIQRGRDYYGRKRESLREAFAVLRRFLSEGLINTQVYDTLRALTLNCELDTVIKEARGLPSEEPLPADDRAFLQELRQEATPQHSTGF